MDWLPGIHSETIQEVTPGQQTAVAHALGTLHALAQQAPSPPNGSRDDRMTERNRLLQELLQSNFQKPHRDLNRLATQPIPLDLLESLPNALRSAKQIALDCHRAMLKLASQNNTRHWMHGDAWRGNWLFDAARCGPGSIPGNPIAKPYRIAVCDPRFASTKPTSCTVSQAF
jgi:Ser/Thr protein kinase RdoA (MazF antagonist)